MNHLTLEFLGTFQATVYQEPVVAFESNKARALLAYLAVEATQAQARTTLAGLFWPEFREENARDNLRHALANLRKLLPHATGEPPFLLIDRQQVQFNLQSQHHLDVAEFTRGGQWVAQPVAEQISRLERAVAFYRGPFLQGFFLDDCSAFEEWLLLTRERLHNQMLTALATLTGHFEETREYDKAESYARRLVALDKLQEEAHCALMRILARRGQRSAALSQYEQCRQVLAAELGAPPGAQTVELHQQIQRGLWEGSRTPTISALPLKPAHRPFAPPDIPNNLPVPTTSFVGRTTEIEAICAFLRQPDLRLLTLHGTGGVGKTRLALQVAHQLLADFANGCFWVELAPLQAVGQIPGAIAQSLGLKESPGLEPLQQLKNHLRHKTLLLVLDNYEHLLEAAPLVTELLNQAGQLKCLVTSREPLYLYGEQEYVVEPLPLPALNAILTPTQLAQIDAVQLFHQRALYVRPQLVLDEALAPIVAEICTRLDGIPLAIELAAARIRQFAPPQILARLKEEGVLAPNLLRSSVRNAASRHQTLQAALAWSYGLLAADEQHLFRRLAVFSGGGTLAAITALCPPATEKTIADLLWRLVDKNLVRVIESPMGKRSHRVMPERFVLLETMRAFGLAQLQAEQELQAAQQIYADYYLTLTEKIAPTLLAEQGPYGCDCLESELPNLIALLQYAVGESLIEWGLRLCNALWKFWSEQGFLATGQKYMFQMLDLARTLPPTSTYAIGLFTSGIMLIKQGDYPRARFFYEESQRLNLHFGNLAQAHHCLHLLTVVTFLMGDYSTCDRLSAEGLAIDRQEKHDWNVGMMLANMGNRALRRGYFAEAQLLLDESLVINRQINHGYGICLSLAWLGMLARCQGNLPDARQHLEAAITLSNQAGYRNNDPSLRNELARLLMAEGNLPVACRELKQSLQLACELGYRNMLLEIGDTLVHLTVALGDFEQTLITAAVVKRLYQAMAGVMPAWEANKFDFAVTTARRALGDETAAAAWAIGEQISLIQPEEEWLRLLSEVDKPA